MSLLLTNVGKAADGASLLPAGRYYQNGVVTSSPMTGQGWLDASTLPAVSTGASITFLEVLASPLNATAWTIRATYLGDATPTACKYWNGTSYSNATDTTPWSNHVVYSGEVHAGVITGGASSSAWLYQITETDTSSGFTSLDLSSIS